MKHIFIAFLFIIISTKTSFSQNSNIQDSILEKRNKDTLTVHILQYRNVIYNFVNHTKLESKNVRKELEDAMKFIITPEEIANMAYDPAITKRDFNEIINKGAKKMIGILENSLIKYKKAQKDQLDNGKYENEKKAARDTFEVNLQTENSEWYDFYIVKNGVTDNWNRDRAMLNDIMNSKSYIGYRIALDDARRHYEAPYFKLHADLVELRTCLLSYCVSATNLYMAYRKRNQIP
jgi:hypothetical protein